MPNRVKPTLEEYQEASEIVKKALDKSERNLPRKNEVTAAPRWTESDFVLEEMDGTAGMAYTADFFEVKFNSTIDSWKNSIRATTAHEYAHTWHYEKRFDSESRCEFVWQYIIDEALTQNFAEKMFPEHRSPYRRKNNKQKVSEYWPEIKENELEKKTKDTPHPYPLYIDKEEESYPNWLGYSMSFYIGQELLENGYNLEEFAELGKKDLIEAGDRLFEN